MHLAPTYVALAASLCLHNVFAVPVCHGEVTDTEPEYMTLPATMPRIMITNALTDSTRATAEAA
jgi:hypothetical protein